MKGRPTPRRTRPASGFADKVMGTLHAWSAGRRDEQRRARDEAEATRPPRPPQPAARVVAVRADEDRKARDRSLRGKTRVRARKAARRDAS